MLKPLKNKSAQAISGEYALLIFLVLAVLGGMSVYFRRAIQARIHDARDYMISGVRVRTSGFYDGNLYKEYEPYYSNTLANVDRRISDQTTLLPGDSSGIFRKEYDEGVSVVVNSTTAPPRDFERTTPRN
jgi:hypothetical protein